MALRLRQQQPALRVLLHQVRQRLSGCVQECRFKGRQDAFLPQAAARPRKAGAAVGVAVRHGCRHGKPFLYERDPFCGALALCAARAAAAGLRLRGSRTAETDEAAVLCSARAAEQRTSRPRRTAASAGKTEPQRQHYSRDRMGVHGRRPGGGSAAGCRSDGAGQGRLERAAKDRNENNAACAGQ